MQKSEKSLEPFLRKLRYQPTNQLSQRHRSYRTSLRPVQKDVLLYSNSRLDGNKNKFILEATLTYIKNTGRFSGSIFD